MFTDINDKKCYNTEHHVNYTGEWDVTIKNKMCQRWDSQTPHAHMFTSAHFPDETLEDAGNYCRDPRDEGHLWCHTTDPSINWQYCDMEHCEFLFIN